MALEESSLRTALASGMKHRARVVMKQGVQARGLKLLARDAREQAERAGIAAADYFCGIAQTGQLTREEIAAGEREANYRLHLATSKVRAPELKKPRGAR